MKRGRGRPRKHPQQIKINRKRFMCEYANPVAQVYVCREHSTVNTTKEAKESKDPCAHLVTGDRFVIYTTATPMGLEERVWPGPKAQALARDEAREMADLLFTNTDEEVRFGTLGSNVLYRNRYFEVQFSQAMSYDRPFVVVDTRFHKVLLDEAGKPRRFYKFFGAMTCAQEEEGKLL